ncbi:hypothetical protein L873DRAFT_1801848 [Choiromyces venosus 120613-1]|uniref:Uncharacterized protein n=1 Tax=Choiromyces venosus 120613-1 TaxID=1336337 RepID=A0A3N4JZY3_9PEZI|nr:hypothetical protein L873DRAFT_1801848 [Choiromyces venosus 120613-1]
MFSGTNARRATTFKGSNIKRNLVTSRLHLHPQPSPHEGKTSTPYSLKFYILGN